MKQLLEIRQIPVSMEFKINNAKYNISEGKATELNINRTKGNFSIQTSPVKIRLDTFESRASTGLKSVSRSVREYSDLGKTIAGEATVNFAEEGNALMDIHNNSNAICEIAFQRCQPSFETALSFSPAVPVQIDWESSSISMQYQQDKMQFDWRQKNAEYDYVPYNIEFKIKEYAKTVITYVGSPIYVPPSSDPNYEGEQFNITA